MRIEIEPTKAEERKARAKEELKDLETLLRALGPETPAAARRWRWLLETLSALFEEIELARRS